MSGPFSTPISQLGCVVPDRDRAMHGWLQLGIGPFLITRGVEISDCVYQGRSSRPKIDVAFTQNNDLQIELIQPVDGEPSSYRDFLAAGREGIHHLGWFFDGYDGIVAAMEREHRPVLQQGNWAGVRFVYLEPAHGNGVITEMIELTAVSRQLFALVRQESVAWDGNNPVRSLIGEAGWGLRWDAVKSQLAHLLHALRI